MTKQNRQARRAAHISSKSRSSVQARHNDEFPSRQARDLRASLRHVTPSTTKAPLAVHRVAVGDVARNAVVPVHARVGAKNSVRTKSAPTAAITEETVTTTTTESVPRAAKPVSKRALKPAKKAEPRPTQTATRKAAAPVSKTKATPVKKTPVKKTKPVARRVATPAKKAKPATRTAPVQKTVAAPQAVPHGTITKHTRDGCVKLLKGQARDGVVVDKFAMKRKLGSGQVPPARSLKVQKGEQMSPSVRRLVDKADQELGNNSDHENHVYLIHEYAEETSEGTSDGTSSMSDYDSNESNTDILSRIRRLFN